MLALPMTLSGSSAFSVGVGAPPGLVSTLVDKLIS
jgi:hypothetical protein